MLVFISRLGGSDLLRPQGVGMDEVVRSFRMMCGAAAGRPLPGDPEPAKRLGAGLAAAHAAEADSRLQGVVCLP
jgi:hypothetical protein